MTHLGALLLFFLTTQTVLADDACSDRIPGPTLSEELLRVAASIEVRSECPLLSEHPLSKDQISQLQQSFSDQRLTPLWAQEYIGADLIQSELNEFDGLTPARVTILDTKTRDHYRRVSSIVSDSAAPQYAVGIGTEKHEILLDDATFDQQMTATLQEMETKRVFPRLLNHSDQWPDEGPIREIFQKLKGQGTISCVSAGNSMRPVDPIKQEASEKDRSIILIGSLSPIGLPSSSSQESEEVQILAPGDGYVLTPANGKDTTFFGGTSAATAFVTGALSNFERLVPGVLDIDLAKKLLEKTALPTLNRFELPRKNGNGTLNAYGIFAVGKRVRHRCASKKGTDFTKCARDLLSKPETYHFTSDGPGSPVETAFDAAFPNCSPGCNGTDCKPRLRVSCDDKRRALLLLRKAAYLNPENTQAWARISCIHRQEGFKVNATFYESLVLQEKSDISAWTKQLPKTKSMLLSQIQQLEILDSETQASLIPELQKALELKYTKSSGIALDRLFRSIAKFRMRSSGIYDRLLASPDERTRQLIYRYIDSVYPPMRLHYAMRGTDDSDESIRESMYSHLKRQAKFYPSLDLEALAIKALRDSSPKVRSIAVEVLHDSTTPLKSLFYATMRSRDLEIRKAARVRLSLLDHNLRAEYLKDAPPDVLANLKVDSTGGNSDSSE